MDLRYTEENLFIYFLNENNITCKSKSNMFLDIFFIWAQLAQGGKKITLHEVHRRKFYVIFGKNEINVTQKSKSKMFRYIFKFFSKNKEKNILRCTSFKEILT